MKINPLAARPKRTLMLHPFTKVYQRLEQTATGITLYKRESVIIFDEIQLMPKVRQAIKYLVADGRYDYIETGSLISIKKNVKDIIRELYKLRKPVGNSLNRKMMRDFRIYMAVGGMPQAVEAYVEGKNFEEIDEIKREIISLYKDNFYKIDSTGLIARMYDSVPTQLAADKKIILYLQLPEKENLKG